MIVREPPGTYGLKFPSLRRWFDSLHPLQDFCGFQAVSQEFSRFFGTIRHDIPFAWVWPEGVVMAVKETRPKAQWRVGQVIEEGIQYRGEHQFRVQIRERG